MKVGDIVKSLPIQLNGMRVPTGAVMTGMIIRCQGIEWLVHWFGHPPNELTFEYSEDLEVISESKKNIRR